VCEEASASHGDMEGPPRGNPAYRHQQRAEKVDEVRNSMEGRRCRERAAAPAKEEALRRGSFGQLATERGKREREEQRCFGARATRAGKKPRRRKIPRRNSQGTWLIPKDLGGTSAVCQTLKWGQRKLRRPRTNHRRGAAFERAYGTVGGAKPRRENPKDGFEMKQARQVVRGARRREGAKP